MTKTPNLSKLKEEILSGLDDILMDEAEKLKSCVERGNLQVNDYTEVRLLVLAKLLRFERDDSSTMNTYLIYVPTEKGREIYTHIYR